MATPSPPPDDHATTVMITPPDSRAGPHRDSEQVLVYKYRRIYQFCYISSKSGVPAAPQRALAKRELERLSLTFKAPAVIANL